MEQWLATTVNLRPTTRARDMTYLRAMILSAFGGWPLAKIDNLAIRNWVAELNDSHRAAATVAKAHQILSKILRGAVDARFISTNPCDRMQLPRIERHEMKFLTETVTHLPEPQRQG